MRGFVSAALVIATVVLGVLLATPSTARADSVTGAASSAADAPAEAPPADAAFGPGAPPAPAPDVAEDPTLRKTVAVRRAGVVLGFATGAGFAGASGYPNNARLIGNPSFYSESPLLVGGSTTFFLMGALTDYLSFGPMVSTASFANDTWTSKGIGVGFRAELFPLLTLVPPLADLAIYGEAGVGATELQRKGDYPSADGTQSFLGMGVHKEFRFFRFLGGHVAGGPFVEYDAIFSTSAERHWLSIGARFAWYGGTVAQDHR
jgi:hypothetical protein